MFGDGHCCVDVIQHDLSALAEASKVGAKMNVSAVITVMMNFILIMIVLLVFGQDTRQRVSR